jgi:hypothetical protein
LTDFPATRVAWPHHPAEFMAVNGGLGGMALTSVGSAYTCYAPLGAWYEDVWALGYLRPPRVLATDQLYEMSWQES